MRARPRGHRERARWFRPHPPLTRPPDTGKEGKGTPRPPEVAVEGGQVKLDDKAPNWKLIGMAFVTFTPTCKTVVLLCEPKGVECWANLAMNGGIRKTR